MLYIINISGWSGPDSVIEGSPVMIVYSEEITSGKYQVSSQHSLSSIRTTNISQQSLRPPSDIYYNISRQDTVRESF